MTESDAQLVGELQEGSRAAFAALYQRYKHRAYVACLRLLGDAEAASDVVQGVFLKLYERSSQIREPERFRQWLFTAIRHDCLTCIGQIHRDSRAREELNRPDAAPGSETEQERSAALNTLLAREIDKLPAELKEAVILREYEGFSYQEIAEITGVKIGLVKFRLFTARKRLARALSPVLKGQAENEMH